MAELAALSGRLRLHVAAGLPALHSSRTELAPRLARGRPAEALPALLGTLFALCAPAHRLCATAALQAARGAAPAPSDAARQALRQATLRDHVQRIAHDWPRQLPPGRHDPGSAALLRSCPLWQRDDLDGLAPWLATHWLGDTPARWLAQHDAAPRHFARQWAQARRGHSPLARLLADLLPLSAALSLADDVPLPLAALEAEPLADAMAHQPGFCLQPTWQGRPRSTGCWSRQADAATLPGTAWDRLLARLVDLLRLAGPQGHHRLASGAQSLPAHAGIAWCEMARGLLVHWVQLTPDGRHIADCRVLAPTEWNFHPHGALARALARLDARQPAAALRDAARCLAVAFDPCVDFDLCLPHTAAVPAVETSSHA